MPMRVSLYECKVSKRTYTLFYPSNRMKVNTDEGFGICVTCFPYFLHEFLKFYFKIICFLCKKYAKAGSQ
jgi:hypothetical protein